MYTITLEVNQICNLRCSYCYLGEKKNQLMSEKVACHGLEIAFLNAEKHKDRRLWVDFVGGEALLSFPFLQNLVGFIEREAKRRKLSVTYSMTTNGTIMNEKILSWLIEHSIRLKLSIDGKESIHNKNRKTISGKGSYQLIESNLPYFIKYEEKTGNYIQVAHVVTQNNYENAFESVKHLVEKLGFRVVDSSIDVTHKWRREELDGLADEWAQILEYYMKKQKEKNPFLWEPILDFQKYEERGEKSGFCGVGLIQMYVRNDGRIYGCAANLGTSGCIGDVERGLSGNIIKKYRELSRDNSICSECGIREKCQNRKCIMNSLAYSGTVERHNPDMCYFEWHKIRIWEKHKELEQ